MEADTWQGARHLCNHDSDEGTYVHLDEKCFVAAYPIKCVWLPLPARRLVLLVALTRLCEACVLHFLGSLQIGGKLGFRVANGFTTSPAIVRPGSHAWFGSAWLTSRLSSH